MGAVSSRYGRAEMAELVEQCSAVSAPACFVARPRAGLSNGCAFVLWCCWANFDDKYVGVLFGKSQPCASKAVHTFPGAEENGCSQHRDDVHFLVRQSMLTSIRFMQSSRVAIETRIPKRKSGPVRKRSSIILLSSASGGQTLRACDIVRVR